MTLRTMDSCVKRLMPFNVYDDIRKELKQEAIQKGISVTKLLNKMLAARYNLRAQEDLSWEEMVNESIAKNSEPPII